MADPGRGTRVPAGWHADPSGRGGLRYWDGTSWTAHTSVGHGSVLPAATPRSRRWAIAMAAGAGLLLVGAAALVAEDAPTSPATSKPTPLLSGPSTPAPESPAKRVPAGVPTGAAQAVVTGIVDGDTIDTDQGRVRLLGIDTPERGAPLAELATAMTAKYAVIGSTVWLVQTPGSDPVDRYGRLVRVVYTGAGIDVSAVVTLSGLASAMPQYSTDYLDEEAAAKARRVGLWAAPESVAPRPKAVAEPPSPAPAASRRPAGNCDPNYSPCVPAVSYDLDCRDVGFRVKVLRSDPHRFDRDRDGWGCESFG